MTGRAGDGVTHFARDNDLLPLCGGGREGDLVTAFSHETTCSSCLDALGVTLADLQPNVVPE